MKKFINKYMLLAVAACAFAACSDDDDNFVPGEWDASAGYADVYFPKTSVTEELDPAAACETTVQVMRRNTGSAVTVPMKVITNTENVFTVSDAVFAAGDSVAEVKVTFPNAAVGSPFKLQFQMEGADYVSSYSGNTLFTYTVTRVKWNDVGFYYTSNGAKVDGMCLYTDDFVTTFFSIQNMTYPVKVQERDDRKGYFRVFNAYGEAFPYCEPGDYDDSKDYYIFIDATNPNKVYIPSRCIQGTDFSYGNFICFSLAGYYLERGDSGSAADYFGTYENGAITFPAESLLFGMSNYQGGGLYASNNNGEFKLVINPDLEIPEAYEADVDADFEWEEVYTGSFKSGILNNTSEVALYVGTCVNNTDDCDKTFAETYGTVYALNDPYGPNSPIYFGVKEDGKITLPVAGPQATGMKALNEDVYAIINAKASSFSENMITLNMTFINKNGSIEYGTTDEVLSNIKWNSLGLATYTEDFITSFFKVENVSYQVEIQEREDMPGVYRLVDPYGAAYPYCQEGDFGATAYMTINCQDPEGCYIEYSPTTTDFGYGNFIMYSYAGYYLEAGYSLDQVKGAGLAGTLADGVITFPEGTLLVGMAAYKDGELVDANNNGAFSVVLPSAAPAEKPALAPKKSMTKTLKDLSGVKTVSRKNKLVGHPVETLVKPIKK